MSQINKIDHFEEEIIASEKPFEDNDLIRLPAEGQKALVEDILNPPEPTPATELPRLNHTIPNLQGIQGITTTQSNDSRYHDRLCHP